MERGHRVVVVQRSLVSVIVPIYNVERYLQECLDSLCAQTYNNLEIILIDDKSPDKSGEIADDYAKRDERIKVIHKKNNEGLNMARSTGFKESSGDFITFVDSDDMLRGDCIEKTLQELFDNDVDMVRFGMKTFKNNPKEKREGAGKLDSSPTILRGKRDLYKTQFVGLPGINSYLMTVWGGLYRREAVEKIEWKKSNFRAYEDNFWTMQLLESINSAFYSNRTGYYYRYNETYTGVLSKKLTDNSLNGKVVGYLEYVDLLVKEYFRINEKYKLKLEEEIDAFARHQWSHRISQIYNYDISVIELEQNKRFLLEGMPYFVDTYNLKLKEEAHASFLKQEIAKRDNEINRLNDELSSFLDIKRSAKLLLGNIKRKLKKV